MMKKEGGGESAVFSFIFVLQPKRRGKKEKNLKSFPVRRCRRREGGGEERTLPDHPLLFFHSAFRAKEEERGGKNQKKTLLRAQY